MVRKRRTLAHALLEKGKRGNEDLRRTSEEDEETTDSEDAELESPSSTAPQDELQAATLITDEQYLARMPSQQAQKKAREAIQERRTQIEELESRCEEAERQLEALRAKRRALEQDITRNHELLSKLRILPNEMLSLIFTTYMESDPDASPWILTSVNRAWRAAALSTPSLWRKITLVGDAWLRTGNLRVLRGSELCCTVAQLERALKRARGGPLHVTLLFENAPNRYHRLQHVAQEISALSTKLREGDVMQRISTLQLEGTRVDTLSHMGSEVWDLPQLREFVAKDGSMNGANVFKMTNLQSLRLHGTQSWMNVMPPANSKLKELSLSGLTLRLQDESASILGTRIQSYSFLTHLEVIGLKEVASSISSATVITLPRLTYLEVEKNDFWPIIAANLDTLILTKGAGFKDGPPGSNQFPTVQTFRGEMQSPDWGTMIKDYRLHSIQNLELRCTTKLTTNNDNFNMLRKDCFSTQLMKPVVIRLQDTRVHEKILLDMLEAIPTLQTLELTGCPIGKVFFTRLAPVKASATIACPSLTMIKVDVHNIKLKEEPKALKTAAKRTVKARVAAGCKMLWASLKLTEDMEWSDLLD